MTSIRYFMFLCLVGGLHVGCARSGLDPACEVPGFEVDGRVNYVHPSFVAYYGCETFEDMEVIEDFGNFCALFQDEDHAISLDVVPGCNPWEESCEWFWVCDNFTPVIPAE